MGNVFFWNWETEMILFLQSRLPEWAMKFFELITNMGDELVAILVMGTVFWCLDKKLGKRMCLFIGVSNVAYPLIKNVACRLRPYMVDERIRCVKPVTEGDLMDPNLQGYSFPSGHSVNSAVIYGTLAFRLRKAWFSVLMVVLVLLIMLSRNVLGVHFPTDVVTGALLGLAVIALVQLGAEKLPRKVLYPILAAVCAVGWLYCTSDDYYTGYGLLIGAITGDLFETKFVNFEKARNLWDGLIRVVCGLGLFLAMNVLLKLPFSSEFLDSGTFAAHLVRFARYAFMVWVETGVYPMLFKYIRVGKEKSTGKAAKPQYETA